MREVPLPLEFAELAGKVNYVQRKSAEEYCSSCPKCGGAIHPDGDAPDRFVMLMPSKSRAGIPWGFCRICGLKWWPGRDDGKHIDPATLEKLAAQAREADERRKAERKAKLAAFSTAELWEELHRRMGEDQREWWRANGVPDSWQDYLRLGYTDDKIYRRGDELLHSPAYTIPYFGYQFTFKTMQYRLVNPDNPSDRYRFEADLGTSYYMTTPSVPIGDEIVICEGAKKAMVVKIYADDDRLTVLAVPSKQDWRGCGVLEAVKDCGRVWVWLDPDCYVQPDNATGNWMPAPVALARDIGRNARVIEGAVKADDAFLRYGMTESEFSALKRTAVRI